MTRDELTARIRGGDTIQKLDLSRADLAGGDFSGAVFEEVDLSGANLRGARFRESLLNGCRLDDAALDGADMAQLSMFRCRLPRARLREAYQDDLFWLASGADGLARLVTEKTRDQTGTTPQRDSLTRGLDDDQQEGRVA